MILEYEAGWKEMEIGQVLFIVGDGADLDGPEPGGKLFILSS